MNTKHKFVSVVVMFILIGCENNLTDEVIILPEGFRGFAMILYEQPRGISIVKTSIGKTNVDIFNIGESGILDTNLKFKEGIFKNKYYFKNSKMEIPTGMPGSKSNELCVWGEGVTGLNYEGAYPGTHKYSAKGTIRFIGTHAEWISSQKLKNEFDKKIYRHLGASEEEIKLILPD